MSWSFSGVGKPEALQRAINKCAESYGTNNQSRAEYDEAAPALKVLVGSVPADTVVSVQASGHCSFEGTKKTYGQIDVVVKTVGKLLE